MNEHLSWRYATKKFDPTRKISQDKLDQLLHALIQSPSSFGLEPWKFVVVTKTDLRQQLRQVAWNQPQITDASHLIVLCALTNIDAAYIANFITRIANVRGVARESLKAYEEQIIGMVLSKTPEERAQWMQRQVYIALGILLDECAHLKIDSCPMEGFDAGKFSDILGLSIIGYQAVVACPIGYRAHDDRYATIPKVRFTSNEVIINR